MAYRYGIAELDILYYRIDRLSYHMGLERIVDIVGYAVIYYIDDMARPMERIEISVGVRF